MPTFIRIKNYIINLENLAYIRVEEKHIDFGFAPHAENPPAQNYIRLLRGSDLQDAEFEQVKEFILQLPDLDRVIVI
jgi:hypothetical protein